MSLATGGRSRLVMLLYGASPFSTWGPEWLEETLRRSRSTTLSIDLHDKYSANAIWRGTVSLPRIIVDTILAKMARITTLVLSASPYTNASLSLACLTSPAPALEILHLSGSFVGPYISFPANFLGHHVPCLTEVSLSSLEGEWETIPFQGSKTLKVWDSGIPLSSYDFLLDLLERCPHFKELNLGQGALPCASTPPSAGRLISLQSLRTITLDGLDVSYGRLLSSLDMAPDADIFLPVIAWTPGDQFVSILTALGIHFTRRPPPSLCQLNMTCRPQNFSVEASLLCDAERGEHIYDSWFGGRHRVKLSFSAVSNDPRAANKHYIRTAFELQCLPAFQECRKRDRFLRHDARALD